ncbi:hypothetical protein ACH3XW_34840 [Acanthocheilonema viteae]
MPYCCESEFQQLLREMTTAFSLTGYGAHSSINSASHKDLCTTVPDPVTSFTFQANVLLNICVVLFDSSILIALSDHFQRRINFAILRHRVLGTEGVGKQSVSLFHFIIQFPKYPIPLQNCSSERETAEAVIAALPTFYNIT